MISNTNVPDQHSPCADQAVISDDRGPAVHLPDGYVLVDAAPRTDHGKTGDVNAMQAVGQNKHLKLRLSKGKHSFDAIYFSATRAACGLSCGDRVDAAFYLQINDFRGNSSVQLQIADLRASLYPSAREWACMRLCGGFVEGGEIAPQEAARLLPGREQVVRVWQSLARLCPDGEADVPELPALRQIAGAAGGAEPFLRANFCVAVFAERDLIRVERANGQLHIALEKGRKVSLEDSSYIRRLRAVLGMEEKGER